MFWFHDRGVIYILQYNIQKQGGKANYACLGKQRGKVKMPLINIKN